MIRPFSASHECGLRLAAAGIPLDYMNNLPGGNARRSDLHLSMVGGDFASRVLVRKDGTITYLVAIRLSTGRSSGIVISDWSITTPWSHHIDWDYDAADVLPVEDHPTYAKLFNSPLSLVLNKKLHLTRIRPVEGLLCGRAFFESIPASTQNCATVHAELSLTTDTGQVISQDIAMIVDRRAARQFPYASRKGRLFEKADVLVQKSSEERKRERDIEKEHKAAIRRYRRLMSKARKIVEQRDRRRNAKAVAIGEGRPVRRGARSMRRGSVAMGNPA